MSTVNTNNPAVKRLLREAREIAEAGPNVDYAAAPLEDNLMEWHFTIRGPPGTAFEGGRYHGRITLPPEYPFKPPSIALLNASGRISVGKKICLSVSAHHPEHWQPAWDIRTIITALIAFFPSKADGALAGLDYSEGERRVLAAESRNWCCKCCDVAMADALPEEGAECAPCSALPPPPAELTFAHEGGAQTKAAPAAASAGPSSACSASGSTEGFTDATPVAVPSSSSSSSPSSAEDHAGGAAVAAAAAVAPGEDALFSGSTSGAERGSPSPCLVAPRSW